MLRASKRRRTVPADVDRWLRILNGARLRVDARKSHRISRERRVRLGPERFDRVDVLVGEDGGGNVAAPLDASLVRHTAMDDVEVV